MKAQALGGPSLILVVMTAWMMLSCHSGISYHPRWKFYCKF